MKKSTPDSFRRAQRGVSLIEVLVTLLIVALALLGAAGLQAQAMRFNKGGQNRATAVFLAGDLAERMETNKDAAIAGSYAMPASSTPIATASLCTSSPCTIDQLAQVDLAGWQSAISTTLPNSSWAVTQTTAGNPSVYTIVISWQERRSDSVSSGTTEPFFYTTTRTVAN